MAYCLSWRGKKGETCWWLHSVSWRHPLLDCWSLSCGPCWQMRVCFDLLRHMRRKVSYLSNFSVSAQDSTVQLGKSTYRGFPTRMVYLYYILCLRYTILVGNPRYAHCHVSGVTSDLLQNNASDGSVDQCSCHLHHFFPLCHFGFGTQH